MNRQQRLAVFEDAALGFADQLFRVALHVVGDREHAEDLAPETYLQVWRSFDRFEPGTNLCGELLVETNLEILWRAAQRLARRSEMAALRNLRAVMRRAGTQVCLGEEAKERLRRRLREEALSGHKRWPRLLRRAEKIKKRRNKI